VSPKIADDAPAAFAAGVFAAGDLPRFANLGMAPGAVAHERHEIFALAAGILAAAFVATVSVLAF
jgi:hypothetical protein